MKFSLTCHRVLLSLVALVPLFSESTIAASPSLDLEVEFTQFDITITVVIFVVFDKA